MDVNRSIVLNKNLFFAKELLGQGAFGKVFLCKEQNTGMSVAIKVEKESISNMLQLEFDFYTKLQGGDGIPHVRFLESKKGYNYLVMELLGPSLSLISKYMNTTFSLKTIIMLGAYMIKGTQFIHERGIIHRDFKPSNFVIGSASHPDSVYLVDFGLATYYRDEITNEHKPMVESHIVGTVRYTSLVSHDYVMKSRRDDIESLLYTLIHLHKGSLPWQVYEEEDVFDFRFAKKVGMAKKVKFPQLCQGLPREFRQLLKYTQKLKYKEEPNYEYILDTMKTMFDKVDDGNNEYDWTLSEREDQ